MANAIPENFQWFRHPDSKQDIYFIGRRGHIVGDKIWTETDVHGGGGGTYYNGSSVQVNPVHISSTVKTKRETWIRLEDGSETSLRTDGSIQVNEGQRVSLVGVGTPEVGRIILLMNRATGRWETIEGDLGSYFSRNFYNGPSSVGLFSGCLIPVLICLVLGVSVILNGIHIHLGRYFYIPGLTHIALIIGLVLCVLLIISACKRVIARNNRRTAARAAFVGHCHQAMQFLL